MQPYTKNYIEYFGYGIDDFIPCEICKSKAVDLHHIERRIKGIKRLDMVGNIIALCRDCHIKAHANIITWETLKMIHTNYILNK